MGTEIIKKITRPVLAAGLLLALLGTVTACEDFTYPTSTPTPQPQPTETAAPATAVRTKDTAILTVYKHLLTQAESYEARLYLSDFYATCDNWTAVSEYFRDGTGTWYVTVDMTDMEDWTLRPYWQQASWYVFKDGETIPSNLYQANALRIEADLQDLSAAPGLPEQEES